MNSVKRARFVGQFLIHGNATLAAKEAGCPEGSAHVMGARWRKDPEVAQAIDEGRELLERRATVTAERVLEELGKVATYDPRLLYDDEGNRIPVHQLDPNTRMAVGSVEDETTEGPRRVTRRVQRIKMLDKLKALELLGKRHKLWTDKVEVTDMQRQIPDEELQDEIDRLTSRLGLAGDAGNAAEAGGA